MKLNKRLIEKMIKRLEEVPESYRQEIFGTRAADLLTVGDRPVPACGTLCCLAGDAVICSERSVQKGIAKLFRLIDSGEAIEEVAEGLMGIDSLAANLLFLTTSGGTWPQPYSRQYRSAKTYKGEARAAINLLKAIIRTDGKILES